MSQQKIDEMHAILVRIDERLSNHISNDTIHQNPPCEAHKSLVNKLWAVVMLWLASIAASIYSAVR